MVIIILLNSSSAQNFYPLYSVFGHPEGVERCQRPPGPVSLHICSAQEVYDLLFNVARHRIESTDILRLTIPMECLFCCPLVHEGPEIGPRNLFDHYFQIPPRDIRNEKVEENNNRNRGYEETVPELITRLFEMKEINDNTAGLIHEYRSMYPGSNALSIVKIKIGDHF